DVLGDDEIEPRAAAAAVEIAGAQNDRAHAAVASLLDTLLDLDAHAALARGRMHRRRFVEHRRHAASVVPDASRKQQGRAAAFGWRYRALSEPKRRLAPLGSRRG